MRVAVELDTSSATIEATESASLYPRSVTSGAEIIDKMASIAPAPMIPLAYEIPAASVDSAPETVAPTTGISPDAIYRAARIAALSAAALIIVCKDIVPPVSAVSIPIIHIKRLLTPLVIEAVASFPNAEIRLIASPKPAMGRRIQDAALPTSEAVVYIPAACTPAVAAPPPSEVTPTIIGIKEVKSSLTR